MGALQPVEAWHGVELATLWPLIQGGPFFPGGCTLSTFALELCSHGLRVCSPTSPPPPGPSQLCPREVHTCPLLSTTPPPSHSRRKWAQRTTFPHQAQLLRLLNSRWLLSTPTATSRALLLGGHVTYCPYCPPREDVSLLLQVGTLAVRGSRGCPGTHRRLLVVACI